MTNIQTRAEEVVLKIKTVVCWTLYSRSSDFYQKFHDRNYTTNTMFFENSIQFYRPICTISHDSKKLQQPK